MLRTPRSLLIDVPNDVGKVTENKQVPWEHSGACGAVLFQSTGAEQHARPIDTNAQSALERGPEAWAAAKGTTSYTGAARWSHGRGIFQIERRRCAGTLGLTRM
jgi:hypothetical protein